MKSSNPNITLEFTPNWCSLALLLGAKRCPLYAGILRKNSYEIFSKFCKTNPIFPSFSPKNNDFTKKQTQFKANQSQFWPKNQGCKANSNPNKPNQAYTRMSRLRTNKIALKIHPPRIDYRFIRVTNKTNRSNENRCFRFGAEGEAGNV